MSLVVLEDEEEEHEVVVVGDVGLVVDVDDVSLYKMILNWHFKSL